MNESNVEKPLVSVVMASYNEAPEIIGQAIDSILAQSYSNLEFIIVDDSTNEITKKKIDSYKDSRIIIIRLEGHSWLPEKLNVGMRRAKGKYIARMDADDIALSNRLALQVEYLEKNAEIYVLGGQINLINSKGVVFSEKRYPLGGTKLYFHSTYKSPFNHPSVMLRRELIEKGFFYSEDLIKTSEDIDLWLRIIHDGYKIANIPETITNYRIRDNMADWRGSREEISYMANVRKRTFSWKMPIHSLLSLLAGQVFTFLPQKTVIKMYKKMYQTNMEAISEAK